VRDGLARWKAAAGYAAAAAQPLFLEQYLDEPIERTLADGGASWGSYYDQDPVVMAGKISLGLRAGDRA
jgi:hypothetical protein